MPNVQFPYGKGQIEFEIPEDRFAGVLLSNLHHAKAEESQEELVRKALASPIGSPKLSELAAGKRNIVVIASDHTRPVPSKIIMPLILKELREGNPAADITILIATGCHRETTLAELADKFGPEIMQNEKIVVHDCDNDLMVSLGELPSGGECILNKIAVKADLLVAEGFIEPHFFAGFSGGRKSVLPGVAGRETVLNNHNSEFIAHPKARAGILDGNPIHEDMIFAARKAGLAFIVNVVINAEKEIVFAIAGDCDKAHRVGCEFLSEKCAVPRVMAEIAIAGNGGYPLDQNIYQAVKGMTAAEAVVKENGVIIMLAQSGDGHGGESFYQTFANEKNLDNMLALFAATPKEKTVVDQWQSQIFARVLKHARVIYVSDAPDDMVKALHMTPARSIGEAVKIAEELLGNPNASIAAIPDGVSVMVI